MQPHGSVGRRDAASVAIAHLSLLFSGLAVQSLLAWLLLPAGRGVYALVAVLAALLPTLCAFGFDRSIQFQLMSGRLSLGAALGSTLVVAAVASTLGMMIGTLVMSFGPLSALAESPGVWWAGLALVGLTAGYTFVLRLLVATRRFREYLAVTLIQGLSNAVLLAAFVAALRFGTSGAIWAFATSYAIGSAFALRWLLGTVERIELPSSQQMPGLARFAAKYYPGLVGHVIDFNAGVLVLGIMASNAEVGLYAALWALMQRFLMLALALQEAVLPRVAADDVGRPTLIAQLSRVSIAATAFITITFCLLSARVLSLLLSPPFSAAADLAWWIAPGLVLHASSSLLMSYFEGTNRPGVVSMATWLGLLSNICFIFVLYPRMGLDGAALALSLGMVFRFVFLGLEFRRLSGTTWRDVILVSRSDARLLLGTAASLLRPGVRGN